MVRLGALKSNNLTLIEFSISEISAYYLSGNDLIMIISLTQTTFALFLGFTRNLLVQALYGSLRVRLQRAIEARLALLEHLLT